MLDIYNPFSILCAFDMMDDRDFWYATGTPTYLVKLLSHIDVDIKQITSKYHDVSTFDEYRADVDNPLPMIYQSGYLTIKDYEKEDDTYLLDYPNNEVKKGFLTMLAAGYLKKMLICLPSNPPSSPTDTL